MVFLPIGFQVGLSTIDYSTKSSRYFLRTPVFDLRTNPDHRTSTQSNLLREVTRVHQAIDAGFGQTGHLFDLRQANEVATEVGHEQKAKT